MQAGGKALGKVGPPLLIRVQKPLANSFVLGRNLFISTDESWYKQRRLEDILNSMVGSIHGSLVLSGAAASFSFPVGYLSRNRRPCGTVAPAPIKGGPSNGI